MTTRKKATRKSKPKLGISGKLGGQFVSLNQKVANYFGLSNGENEQPALWLSAENWVDKLPETLTPEQEVQIEKALSLQKIILGKEWIPAIDKNPSVLDGWLKVLSKSRTVKGDFELAMQELFRYKQDGNYTALEIATAMLEKEESSLNRPHFVQYLTDFCNHCDGPNFLVEDYPEDPENYTVTINRDTMEVTDIEERNDKPTQVSNEIASRENPTVDDPQERSRILDSLI